MKRAKLEALANLSDDEIRKQLEAWPAYNKMSLRDQETHDAHAHPGLPRLPCDASPMQKAHDMGLLTLTPDQQAKFEKEYWDKRLKMDQDLAKQFQPVYQAREQTMNDQLFREFSSAMPAPGAAARPSRRRSLRTKPPQPPVKPVAYSIATRDQRRAAHRAGAALISPELLRRSAVRN